MSDLDAALEPVRAILARRDAARRDAARRNGAPKTDSMKEFLEALAALSALPEPADVNGSGFDWELFDRNQAEVREIAKRLRNAGH